MQRGRRTSRAAEHRFDEPSGLSFSMVASPQCLLPFHPAGWLAINSEGGDAVETSPLEIDKKYEEFMHETLKKTSSRTLATDYFLIPDFVAKAIEQHQHPRRSSPRQRCWSLPIALCPLTWRMRRSQQRDGHP